MIYSLCDYMLLIVQFSSIVGSTRFNFVMHIPIADLFRIDVGTFDGEEALHARTTHEHWNHITNGASNREDHRLKDADVKNGSSTSKPLIYHL